jgi:hypothetical protein
LAKFGDFGGKFIRCVRSFADRFVKNAPGVFSRRQDVGSGIHGQRQQQGGGYGWISSHRWFGWVRVVRPFSPGIRPAGHRYWDRAV